MVHDSQSLPEGKAVFLYIFRGKVKLGSGVFVIVLFLEEERLLTEKNVVNVIFSVVYTSHETASLKTTFEPVMP